MMEQENYNIIDGNSLIKPKTSIVYKPPKEELPLLPQIISFILNPLFVVTYTVFIIFMITDFRFLFANQLIRFMTPVLFFSCIAPVTGIYFLRLSKIVQNYRLDNKNEWFLPITIFFISYSLLFYYFFSAKLYTWFLAVVLVPLILLVIYVIISRFWKISAYMMSIGGAIGCILSICYNIKGLNLPILFSILFILAGCLGVSRLILRKSTPPQVYIGFLAGFLVSYMFVYGGAYWGFILFLKNL